MSSHSDAHSILLDVDEITDRLRTTYDTLNRCDSRHALDLPDDLSISRHSLDRLSIEQTIGRLIELRRSIVGYLDEWDGTTYSVMADRGWL